MGMFDTVYFICDCGSRIKKQNKEGKCQLDEFDNRRVPISIAADMDGQQATCENCLRSYKIRANCPMEVHLSLIPDPDHIHIHGSCRDCI